MLRWMMISILMTALVSIAAAALDIGGGWLRARRVAPSFRRWIWLAAILASTVLPVVKGALDRRVVVTPEQTIGTPAADPGTIRGPSDRSVLLAWIAVSGILALWFTGVHLAVRNKLRGAPRLMLDGAPVALVDGFGPAVVGVIHPRVALPRWVLSLSDSDRRLVIAHEREHLRTHDPVLRLIGLAAAILVPWNAAVWWQLRRLDLAIEIDCDARVIAPGADPVRYGEVLLEARAHSARLHGALALSARPSALRLRIEALAGRRPRSGRRAVGSLTVAMSTLIGIVALPPAPLPLRPERAITTVEPSAETPLPILDAPPGPRLTPARPTGRFDVAATLPVPQIPRRARFGGVVAPLADSDSQSIRGSGSTFARLRQPDSLP